MTKLTGFGEPGDLAEAVQVQKYVHNMVDVQVIDTQHPSGNKGLK